LRQVSVVPAGIPSSALDVATSRGGRLAYPEKTKAPFGGTEEGFAVFAC
jgi:hypothetical protein